ncbi:DNA primase [Psychrobacillus sp. Sa2BUA9]|uniref:DNA primase n=2 Tax=Psychrobacillus faecigallinarum TaxID=2762235 RepID=A0ABR8RC55_9BACI|nr:DNA primase [Psychrobacillus faecigallinarum]
MAITEKSKILLPVMENIPEELKLLPQWVIWKAILNDKNEYTKVPFRANGKDAADSTNRNTWETFADVEEAYLNGIGDGIGFVLSKEDPYACIDIDGIEDIDNLSALNLQITNASYTEISPSGSGLHVWIKGYKHDSQKFKNKNTKLGYEIYDSKRFLTLTGESKNSLPISGGPEIENFINIVFKREENKQLPTVRTNDVENNLTESDIIRIATNSKTGARFNSCFRGGWESLYSSQSEADLAFCNDLAFWTNCNYQLMDSIFRQSSLMREKWGRRQNTSTYGDETLKKAINECTNTFSPKTKGHEVILSDEDSSFQVRETNWWATNANGTKTLLHNVLGSEVMKEFFLVRHPNPHSDLYYYNYNKGIYEQDKSGRQVSAIIRNKDDLKRNQVREVQEYVTDMSPVINNANTNYIAVENGLLNLKTFQLEPFSPKIFVTQKINTTYNPNANDSFIEETLQKVTKGHVPSYQNICEMFACVLYPEILVPKMFYLYGRTAHNGKSSVLNMIFETFDKKGGQISAVSPQKLANNTFAGAAIYGKLANIVDDQPDAVIEDSGMLKTIITGGRIEIERKGKDSESVKMSTPLITASNYFPNFKESGNQINRRLHIIPFEYSFTEDKNCVSDSESMQRIASQSGREYVLKLAVDALKRMLLSKEADKLTYNEKSVEVGKLFAEQNDPLSDYFFEYTADYFIERPGSSVINEYNNWCTENSTHPLGRKRFKEAVSNKYDLIWDLKNVYINGGWKSTRGFKKKEV